MKLGSHSLDSVALSQHYKVCRALGFAMMSSQGADSLQSNTRSAYSDPYFAHEAITLAITKFICTTPSLRWSRLPAQTPSPISTPVDIYVARVIHKSHVPNIVPYAALYILAAVSRTCNCHRPSLSSSDGPPYDYDYDDSDESSQPPSALFHRLSETLTRSPLSRVRKSHWVGHHLFIGAFLVALREHQNTMDFETLSDVTGFERGELRDLLAAISSCMDKDTKLAVEWMVKEGEFRSLWDVECPFIVMRRKRHGEWLRKEDHHGEYTHFRWPFSHRRSRKTGMDAFEFESSFSEDSESFISSSSSSRS